MTTYLKPGIAPGSVEHFYHFVLQYLLPLFEKEITDGIAGKGFSVRDCGPMNVWFDFIFGPEAFSIVSRDRFPKKAPKRFWDKHIQLDAFANKRGLVVDVDRFTDVLTVFRSRFVTSNNPIDTVTILDRGMPPAFYLDGRAEKPGGGSIRRSISNLDQLSLRISERMPVNFIDFADLSPAEQLAAISRTRVLVGQHGAGLVNSIFMHEDSTLVEMNIDGSWCHFRTLNEGLGRPYRAFHLEKEHATLSSGLMDEIADYVGGRA